jgi:aminoglycoside phosphotransferase (APT) family kinase protein
MVERDVVPLGQGLDNSAFLVEDLVLRVSDGPSVVREARLLDVVAPRVSVPLPRPRFADAELGVLAYQVLPGRPLLGRPAFAGLARRLGGFLRELHGMDPAVLGGLLPRDDAEPEEWLATSPVLPTSWLCSPRACLRPPTSTPSCTPTSVRSTCSPWGRT